MTTESPVQSKAMTEKIKIGDVFSRHSFGSVIGLDHNNITVKNTDGKVWTINKEIVQDEFEFAEHCDEVAIKTSRTELIELIMTIPRVAMTITFHKKPDPKEAANMLRGGQGEQTDRQWNTAVKKAMEGEERVMKGYHTAILDSHGRLRFVSIGEGMRLVDPRTITECITCNKRYVV